MDDLQLTQLSLLIISIVTILPGFMIFLSLSIPAKISRWLNLIVGVFYLVISIASLIGESWAFWIFYCSLLTLTSIMVIIYSWKWPLDNLN